MCSKTNAAVERLRRPFITISDQGAFVGFTFTTGAFVGVSAGGCVGGGSVLVGGTDVSGGTAVSGGGTGVSVSRGAGVLVGGTAVNV